MNKCVMKELYREIQESGRLMFSLVEQEFIEYLFCVRHCIQRWTNQAGLVSKAPRWLEKAWESGIHNAVNVQALIILELHARAPK